MIKRSSQPNASSSFRSGTKVSHRFKNSTLGAPNPRSGAKQTRIRYAVVGLGHIAQVAVLPAFSHANRNSQLVALVSGDKTKLRELGKRYQVPILSSYQDYDKLLHSGEIDAVYIAEPNSLHSSFTIRAANAGVHVLCEKPLAVTEKECEQMLAACKRNRVKLMTAYRLHFEKSNLEAARIVQSGKIGEPRIFSSTFTMQAAPGNIRLKKALGGGPLYDLGIYCINAARYLFREEPLEVEAYTATGKDKRFREVEEMVSATMRFPGERLANFICSFGASDIADYSVIGTKGVLQMHNAYEYVEEVEMELSIDGKTQNRTFAKRDQFGPELVYFSNCILNNTEPEPSGIEGSNDIRIIRAIYESARRGARVRLNQLLKKRWPSLRQEIKRPPVKKPELVKAEAGSE